MILNHIYLAVSDVQGARGFLMKHFGLDPQGMPGNDRIAFLRDEVGMVLTLTNIDGATEVTYPGAFHIGFGQESPEMVDEINRRLPALWSGCSPAIPAARPELCPDRCT